MAEQLCLNLGEVPVTVGGRVPKPIPTEVKDIFTLSPDSPSGLAWKHDRFRRGIMAGDPVIGTLIRKKYRLVHIPGHGPHYAHRIVYYLQTSENPGHMVVRHLSDGTLTLGYQDDNLKDTRGVAKNYGKGYKTARMYEHNGEAVNFTQLCKNLGLNYNRLYTMIRNGRDPKEVLAAHGFPDVKLLFTQ